MKLDLEQLRDRRAEILCLAAKYGARNVRIFGSVARGEATAESDVDVLVDFEAGRSLLDQAGLQVDLEDILGCKVDVVVEGGISPYLEPSIKREAIPL